MVINNLKVGSLQDFDSEDLDAVTLCLPVTKLKTPILSLCVEMSIPILLKFRAR